MMREVRALQSQAETVAGILPASLLAPPGAVRSDISANSHGGFKRSNGQAIE